MAGVGYLGVGAPEARIKCADIWQAIEQRLHVSADKVTMVRAAVRNLGKRVRNTEDLDAS